MEEIKNLKPLDNVGARELADAVAEILDDKKGRDIKIMAIADKTDIADYFVLCNGTSNTHIRTLADEVEYQVGLRGLKPISFEGRGNNSWILIDYGFVVVHVFSREAREFYNLDKLYRSKRSESEENDA
ncbi:MAG: ribosome silencing factor [Clostridia bacterium]|nr:ribosome silencing factor [Clostridia bacterium]